MISKPLFKQSVKANRGIWCFVTFITCAMLAIIISVLGNLNIDEIRGSLSDTFIKNSLESQVEEQSMTYFYMSDNALTSYEYNVASVATIRDSYNGLIAGGYTDEQARDIMTSGKTTSEITTINYIINLIVSSSTGFSDSEVKTYVLNQVANGLYNQLVSSEGEETANNAKLFISTAITEFASQELTTTEFATNYIPEVLQDAFYDQSFVYDGDTFLISTYLTKTDIRSKSYSSIMSFRAEMEVKKAQLTQEVNNDDFSARRREAGSNTVQIG